MFSLTEYGRLIDVKIKCVEYKLSFSILKLVANSLVKRIMLLQCVFCSPLTY